MKRIAIISLVCAVVTVFLAPVVFGPLGVLAGSVAVWKGDRWWGALGVSGSAVAAVVGYYFAHLHCPVDTSMFWPRSHLPYQYPAPIAFPDPQA